MSVVDVWNDLLHNPPPLKEYCMEALARNGNAVIVGMRIG